MREFLETFGIGEFILHIVIIFLNLLLAGYYLFFEFNPICSMLWPSTLILNLLIFILQCRQVSLTLSDNDR